MAETVGSLIDKLTIVELRRWHTEEAMLNAQASVTVRHTAALRLHVIDEQRSDLAAELDQLWKDIIAGTKRPKIYRQMKMYNDNEMRAASTGEPPLPQPSAEAPPSRTQVLALRRSTQ